MSYDPSGFAPDQPPPERPDWPGQPPPLSLPDTSAARAKVQLPAIFLIVVGALNLLGAAGAGFVGAQFTRVPPAEVERMMQQRDPARWQQLRQEGWTAEQFLQIYVYGGFGTAVANVLSALIMIWGGSRMLVLKSYGLSVFASVLAAVPCISASACCGLGEIVGLWAVIVLARQEVREAFR
jgi:hypothetical protein